MEKLIISVGLTGSRITKEQTPYIPITPEEIILSGLQSWLAGASVLHVHVRDPKTGLGTQNVNIFKKVTMALHEKTKAILCITTSGIPGRNLSTKERLKPLALNPELASFDAGSLNLGGKVFINSPEFLEALAKETLARGIKPELEIFEPGMVSTCLHFLAKGLLRPPLHFQFVMGATGGMPATPELLLHLLQLIPKDSTWSVAGIGPHQLPMATLAMILGGHVRVGLEDNIYYSKGVLAVDNAQLVARIISIARDLKREIARPDEARRILSLGDENDC